MKLELGDKRTVEPGSPAALTEARSLQTIGEERESAYSWGPTVRRRQTVLLLGVVCLAAIGLLFHSQLQSHIAATPNILSSIKIIYKELVPLSWALRISGFKEHFLEVFANPYYYLGVGAVFCLEWLFPVKKSQRILSVGFAQDLLYYFALTMVLIYFTAPYAGFLEHFYRKNLFFLAIGPVAAWPLGIRAAFGLVLNDLLHWTHHFLRHRIKPLWYFHAVHHSQREMNLFTDIRSHFVDIFFAITIMFIPLNMFNVNFSNSAWVYFIPVLYFRLYHANIKTNFGPLKYILVTPQSHRIHHSVEQKHWEKNYGFIFTIWDQLFGTQYKNYDEYPDTGISDENFPLAKSFRGIMKVFVAQLLYPFGRLFRGTYTLLAAPQLRKRQDP